MIDLTYPTNIEEWKNLVQKVEDESQCQILCGMSGIPEMIEAAAELMQTAAYIGSKKATDNYFANIAAACFENKEIGKQLYMFFAKNIQELGIPAEKSDINSIFENVTMREWNKYHQVDLKQAELDAQNFMAKNLSPEFVKACIISANLSTVSGKEFILINDEDENPMFTPLSDKISAIDNHTEEPNDKDFNIDINNDEGR